MPEDRQQNIIIESMKNNEAAIDQIHEEKMKEIRVNISYTIRNMENLRKIILPSSYYIKALTEKICEDPSKAKEFLNLSSDQKAKIVNELKNTYRDEIDKAEYEVQKNEER